MNNLCEYGCGQEVQYKLKNGKGCCSKFSCSCPKLKEKNSLSIKQAHIDGRCKNGFKGKEGWSKNLNNTIDIRLNKRSVYTEENKQYIIDSLKLGTCKNYKTAIFKLNLLEYVCDICKIKNVWNNSPLQLQIDHKNGNHHDNRLENLRFLCPNCHSQTDTFRGRKRKLKVF